jgi:Zn-dependent oligopeptidase
MMFENWCYEEEVLTKISSHYQNGEVMPKELQKNLVKSRIANLGFLFRRTNHIMKIKKTHTHKQTKMIRYRFDFFHFIF